MANSLDDFLAQSGRVKGAFRFEAKTETEKVIRDWIEERRSIAREKLEEDDREGSGALKTSIAPNYDDLPTEGIVTIMAEDYWDYINSGVNGVLNNFGAKYSFKTLGVDEQDISDFKEWIRNKGITPFQPDMSYDELAYVLASSTKRKGIRSTPFMDEAFDEASIKDLATRLGKAIVLQFQQPI